MSEPLDRPAADPPITRQCTAHTSSGRRCRRPAMHGATVCQSHGGRAPQVRAAARARLAEQDAQRALATLGVTPVTDPIPVLQQIVGGSVATLTILREKVDALNGDLVRTNPIQGTEEVRAIYAAFERAEDRAMRALDVMIRRDIVAKSTQADRALADRVTEVIRHAIAKARSSEDTDTQILAASIKELLNG